MSVNWYWKDHLGYLSFKKYDNKGKYQGKYKIDLYQANCLGCLIFNYKDKETKKPMYRFQGFWGNKDHLKDLLGLSKDFKENIYNNQFDKLESINLNTFFTRNTYEIKDMNIIAELFTKARINVKFYYKEIKEKKGKN